jgi:mono/diheme cytochrome c family protein
MKKCIPALALAIVGVAAVYTLRAQTSRSVWDGVYSQEQATRGQSLYSEQCAACHGSDLMGQDEASPLTGDQFLSNYNGLTVGDLFDRIRVSMPANNPGKLTRQQTADILAYILSFNKFPAGNTELATQTEVLKQIKLEATKP